MLLDDLKELQAREGWLPEAGLREIAQRRGTPLHRLASLSTFYTHFRRTPPKGVALAVRRDGVRGLGRRQMRALALSRGLVIAVIWRLVDSRAVALALAPALALSGPARQAGLIEAAMPTAVATTVLAQAYDAEPGFVTTAIFVTTLASPPTLTPLLAWLGAG